MGTALVQIEGNSAITHQPITGSSMFGSGGGLFKLTPANVDLQQKTSRSEGSQEGKFRNAKTGEHYDELNLVLIFEPTEQRTLYKSQNDFGEAPLCYSMNAQTPSDKAESPQALNCARCKHSDWSRYKKTKKREDLPKCKNSFKLFAVDRKSKIPFRVAVRGKSVTPFRAAMETISSFAELYNAEHGHYPNIYDFSFKVKSKRVVNNQGVFYEMIFEDIKMVSEDARAEFGALFEKFIAARAAGDIENDAEEAEDDLEKAMSEADSSGRAPVESKPKVTIEVEPDEEDERVVTI